MRNRLGISEAELKTRHSEEVQDLKRKIAAEERRIEEYRAAHGSIAAMFDAMRDAIPRYEPRAVEYVAPKFATSKPRCGMALLICDSHYGAVQRASEIEGFGEYSPEICEQRSMRFIAEVLRYTELSRRNYQIDTAHVLVAGDLISGDIHVELQVTNAFPAPQQVVGAARILASQIMMLAPHYKDVKVHFITEDNHARLTKKPQAKEAGINSFNYLVGEMAKVMCAKCANVEFTVYPQYEAVVNVEGRKYLLLHGHNMTAGFGGISWYGIERKVAKEAVKRLNSTDAKRFHKVILGHWHSPMSTPRFWIGGSVSGTDAYDHKWGRDAEPSQASWLVHPKHGEFARVDWKL